MKGIGPCACLACAVVWSLAASAAGATYRVGSIPDLASRVSSAVAGDVIIVGNGVYTNAAPINISSAGRKGKPIVIRAESIGGVEIKGSNGFSFVDHAAYVTVEGFKFTHSASININSGTSHCRLSRNFIELSIPPNTKEPYVTISGDDIEIDHNELRNKSTLGNM